MPYGKRHTMTTKNSHDDVWRHRNIGRLLNNAVSRFEKRILEEMEKAGHGGLSLSHITITRNLDINGTRATELARRAGITKQSAGELIIQLESLGLIERRPDPLDRRAKMVCFTNHGIAWLNAFAHALEIAEQEMAQQLGQPLFSHLRQALLQYVD